MSPLGEAVRLSKHLSSVLKLCTRREADQWMTESRVMLNGQPAILGSRVEPGDKILIKGLKGEGNMAFQVEKNVQADIARVAPRVFIANKREKQICTRGKPNNILEILESQGLPRGMSIIGGLDVMASGLLLLTDSSLLREQIDEAKWNQVYYLKCASKGPPDNVALKWLKSGPKVGKVKLPSVSATVLQAKYIPSENSHKSEISIAFRGSRFHEIREFLKNIGLAVTDAERRKFGPFTLDRIPPGQFGEVRSRALEEALNKGLPDWVPQMQARAGTADR